MEVSYELHVPTPLYPLDMKLLESLFRSGHCGGEKKSLAPVGNRTINFRLSSLQFNQEK
jgi:hypothetical protein